MKKGILIVISGFAGTGKGTAMKRLTEKYSNYSLSISATTRSPRDGEEEGREYFFKSRQEFEKMIAENRLIEYAEYVGNYYGTPKEYVDSQLEKGQNVILEIEIQGALKVKEKFPDTVLIFMMAPSARELHQRIVGRGTEDAATIARRMSRAVEEAAGIKDYDYVVVNDEIEKCVEDINNIVKAVQCKPAYRMDFIDATRNELKEFCE